MVKRQPDGTYTRVGIIRNRIKYGSVRSDPEPFDEMKVHELRRRIELV
jgi:fibronectin type 3 domain-containing protein